MSVRWRRCYSRTC